MSGTLLPSFRRQQLLLEFAALKKSCPSGIYLAPSASTASAWSGVLSVREGPYASALVRFEVTFPAAYPDSAPLIVVSTELFHPLLVPLTTYTLTGDGLDANLTISAADTTRPVPGSFNLQYGFPAWFTSSNGKDTKRSSMVSSIAEVNDGSSSSRPALHGSERGLQPGEPPILSVLRYFKRAFEDFEFLDTLPLVAAANKNAWHAWRAHRGLPRSGSRSISPASFDSSRIPSSPGRHPADWNWEGVWQSRADNGILESIGDGALYSNQSRRPASTVTDGIRFLKMDDDKVAEVQKLMLAALGVET